MPEDADVQTALEVTTKSTGDADVILIEVNKLEIKTHDDAIQASKSLDEVKIKSKRLDLKRVDLKAGALETCREIDGFFKPAINAYDELAKIYRRKINGYNTEQARIVTEKQEKEQLRVKKIEDDKKAKILEQAKKAEEKGNTQKAESLTERADAYVAPVKVIPKAQKVTGFVARKRWVGKVIDKSKVPLVYMDVNQTKLNKFAVMHKENANGQVPGVQFYSENI